MGSNSSWERKGRQDATAGKLAYVPPRVSNPSRLAYGTAFKSQKLLNDKKNGGKR